MNYLLLFSLSVIYSCEHIITFHKHSGRSLLLSKFLGLRKLARWQYLLILDCSQYMSCRLQCVLDYLLQEKWFCIYYARHGFRALKDLNLSQNCDNGTSVKLEVLEECVRDNGLCTPHHFLYMTLHGIFSGLFWICAWKVGQVYIA